MKKIFILILLLLPVCSYGAVSKDTFSSFASRMHSWAEDLDGTIVSVGQDITIDLGKFSNIVPGMVFSITREGEALYHPSTGEFLGKKRMSVGTIVVKRVENKYSICDIMENKGIKRGDNIEHTLPVPIEFSFSELSEDEKVEVKLEVLHSDLFTEKEESPYKLSCYREKKGDSIASCVFSYNNFTVLETDVEVKGLNIISTAAKVDFKSKRYTLDDNYKSIAAGFLFGKDKGLTIALTDGKKVHIYKYDNEELKKYTVIAGFGNIVNLEINDIDKNGQDELFISDLNKERKSFSSIYSSNSNGKLMRIQRGFPYLLRTFYINNKKVLIGQKFDNGYMAGDIYQIEYNETTGSYTTGKSYKSGNIGLFGFAYGNIGGKNNEDLIYFNNRNIMHINGIPLKNTFFGESINYIVRTESLSTGVEVGGMSGSKGYFVADEKNIAMLVHQRIIEYNKGKLVLYANIPSIPDNSDSIPFKSATIGEYLFIQNTMTDAGIYKIDSCAVVDMDVSPDGKYMVIAAANDWKKMFLSYYGGKTIIHVVSKS